MKFLWPEALALLLLLPALVAAYVWALGRRRRAAVRYANLGLVREAIGAGGRWRRHLPPLLFLLALAALLLAIARPTAFVTLPTQHETVILAMDVSGSMRATDVEPNRITAAQLAAKAFVAEQPPSARVGVVAFAGTASLVQPPTGNREDIVAAIDRFQLQRGTAIGSGIVVSLATIFPDAGIEIAQLTGNRESKARPLPADGKAKPEKPEFTPVPPGSYASAVIILLTDGQRTTGPDPLEAAKLAADRGVRVYTVGIGTPAGEIIGFEGWSMRVRLDEETLKKIALITHGEYFYAGDALELRKIYSSLNSRIALERKQTEVTALFAAAGALLAFVAALISLIWYGRLL